MRTPTKELLRPDAPGGSGEQYLSDAARASPIGILVIRDGLVVDVNDAAVRMMGFQSSRELCGRHFSEFVSPKYRQVLSDRDRLRHSGATVPDEYQFMGMGATGLQAALQARVTRVDLPSGPVTVFTFQELDTTADDTTA